MPSFRDVVSAMKSTGEHTIFEITPEGGCTFHGYSVDDVERLLQMWRDHMLQFARGMQDLQSGVDAVRYRPQPDGYAPVGPEDV